MSTVTFSKNTLTILKNFSSLNSNLLVKPGNVIKTITPSKTGMAVATIEETFDVEFGIWDLNKFLGVVSLFNNPTFNFGDKSVKIKNGGDSVVNYYYSEPRLLTCPTKDVNMPEINVSIMLTERNFNELQKAASVMQLPDMSFKSDDGDIVAMVSDLGDPTSNSYKVVSGTKYTGPEFLFNFKMENIKILPGSYDVVVSQKLLSRFSSTDRDLKYYIALEPDSTFN